MSLLTRVQNRIRGRLKAWGTAKSKQSLWNKEFTAGLWDRIENTPGDCVYRFIEKYAGRGDILDLGCGSGNTAVEIDFNKYNTYVGVDISDIALAKAKSRSAAGSRSKKNSFIQADTSTFRTAGAYDVILFRESIYYIPLKRVSGVLKRYRQSLKAEGVFIVRLCDVEAYREFLQIIEADYTVKERYDEPGSQTVVIVFS